MISNIVELGSICGRLAAARQWLFAADRRWLVAIVAVSIVTGPPMIVGYAVIDELVVYCLLAVMLLAPPKSPVAEASIGAFERLHYWTFIAFALFMIVESVRGMIALNDVRVVRFAVMFAALGFIAYRAIRSKPAETDRLTICRIFVKACIACFVIYVAVGIIAEWFLNLFRFDLQGFVWSGTTVAVLPVVVALPALVMLGASDEKDDMRLYWSGYSAILFTGFYYQSRFAMLGLLSFIVVSAFFLARKKTAIAAALFAGFLLLFPWTETRALTPDRFAAMLYERAISVELIERFAQSIFGGVFNVPHADAKPGERREAVADIDRKLAVIAAFHYVSSNGASVLLWGAGYYTHRYNLLPSIQKVAKQYDFKFPATYQTIVRTAMFNGMLADTGVIGIGLFAVLFGLTVLSLIRGAMALSLAARGPHLMSIICVGLAALSLVIAASYDLLLLYLAVMPCGAMLLPYETGRGRAA